MATFDVLLPVRNGVLFLAEAIESIRRQTFSDWRLLILDHGSSDGSIEVAESYAQIDRRIVVLSFPNAEGLGELLNAGLEKCDCRYVIRQDADDTSVPNRMSVVSDFCNNNRQFTVVGGDAYLTDRTGNQIGCQYMPTSPTAITAAGFFYNSTLHGTMAVDFPNFQRLGARYGEDILKSVPPSESLTIRHLAEDYFLYGQLGLLGQCVGLGVPLINYRKHENAAGISNPLAQIKLSLQISRFLAKSFCIMKGLEVFDPGPFCNHAEYVFDYQLRDYSAQYAQMADVLRKGLGQSTELERELAYRWILATRRSSQMAGRYLLFRLRHTVTPAEHRVVRNWLLRNLRNYKYVYRSNVPLSGNVAPDGID
jgi:glycosyltransferase involved in cell wall biosynthesis